MHRSLARPAHAGAALLVVAVGAGLLAGTARADAGAVSFVETSAQQVDTPLSNGTFALDSAVADVDGDGHLDLLNVRYGNGLGIQYGRGDGTFEPVQVRPYPQQSTRVAVGDLDEDGYDDVVTTSLDYQDASVVVYRGTSTRDLAAPVQTPVAAAPGGNPWDFEMRPVGTVVTDLDGDGHLDVVLANGTESWTVLAGDGTGALTPTGLSVPVGIINSFAALHAGDLDGDGRPDLLSAFRGGLTVWLSTSAAPGQFGFDAPARRVIDGRGFESQMSELADLDGDGALDLVFGSVYSNSMDPVAGLFVLRGTGDGTFAAGVEEVAPGNHTGVAVADLDGDTLLDVASVNADTAAMTVYVANGDGTYTPAAATNPIGETHQVLTADFDGDGAPDLQSTSHRDYVSHVLTSELLFQAPVVTTHPQDAAVAAGQTTTLSAAATGNPTPGVQWEVSTDDGATWAPVDGATSNELTTEPVDTGTSGYAYRAVFTSLSGTVTSEPAVVDLAPAPVVTTDPQATSTVAGGQVTFTAAASGDDVAVRWQVSTDDGVTYTDLPDENALSLVLTATEDLDGNVYRAVFTSAGGERFSAGAVLTVAAAQVGTAPSAPRDVVAIQTGSRQITISWIAPSDQGGSPVTAYDAGYATPAWGDGGQVPADTFSAVFDDVDPGEYTASVAAVNAEGTGQRVFVPVTVGTYPPPDAGTPPAQGAGGPAITGTGTPVRHVADRTSDRAADRSSHRSGQHRDELARTGLEVLDGLTVAALSLGLGLLLTGLARRRSRRA